MDEVDFVRAVTEAASLIDKGDTEAVLRLMLRMLNALNDRTLEMQEEEDDE